MNPRVLLEDNHLLVVSKPANLLTQADRTGDVCLVDWAKAYRKDREAKPGNVYIGLVHRLDRPVSGIVLLAKTSKAAGRLSEQFRSRSVHKFYLAVIARPKPGRSVPMIGRDVVWQRDLKRPGPADDVDPHDAPVREGVTRCRLRHVFGDRLLVELEPMTGRKHQLRQESALRLGPIVGDRRYGSTEAFSPGIALHASLLTFAHPINEAEVRIVDPPPPSWRRFHLPREATSFDG